MSKILSKIGKIKKIAGKKNEWKKSKIVSGLELIKDRWQHHQTTYTGGIMYAYILKWSNFIVI